MNKFIKYFILGVYCLFSTFILGNSQEAKPNDTSIRIAFQAWSFKQFTFQEAVQQAAKIGFKYVEMYSGQIIKPGTKDITHFTMSPENRGLIKTLLRKNGITLVQYGVVTCKSKEEWIQLFEFAKFMGIETINSEPAFEDYPLLDSLTKDYQINLAVHNHANPTRYWEPETALNLVKDKNPRLGICPDNGHWMRSGFDPVETLKKNEGRLLAMHIKDMNTYGIEAHTVPFGTGILNAEALISELKRQHFNGVLTLENEYNWDKPGEDLAVSLKNLTKKL